MRPHCRAIKPPELCLSVDAYCAKHLLQFCAQPKHWLKCCLDILSRIETVDDINMSLIFIIIYPDQLIKTNGTGMRLGGDLHVGICFDVA